jgi:hypothetical protein
MNGKIINDVVCSKEDDFADQHFYVRYDKCKSFNLNLLYIVKNCYLVKDLGLGSGTFLRCQTEVHSVRFHNLIDGRPSVTVR